jgi:hypothetical protein
VPRVARRLLRFRGACGCRLSMHVLASGGGQGSSTSSPAPHPAADATTAKARTRCAIAVAHLILPWPSLTPSPEVAVVNTRSIRAQSGWRGPAPPALPSDAGQTDLPDAPAVRVTVELCRNGRHINRKRVERLMRERGIVGITRRRRRALTKQDAAAAPDRPGAVSLQRCRRAHVHLGHGSHELSSDSPLGTIKFVSPRYHRWHRALAAVRTARTGQRRGTRRSARRPRR